MSQPSVKCLQESESSIHSLYLFASIFLLSKCFFAVEQCQAYVPCEFGSMAAYVMHGLLHINGASSSAIPLLFISPCL